LLAEAAPVRRSAGIPGCDTQHAAAPGGAAASLVANRTWAASLASSAAGWRVPKHPGIAAAAADSADPACTASRATDGCIRLRDRDVWHPGISNGAAGAAHSAGASSGNRRVDVGRAPGSAGASSGDRRINFDHAAGSACARWHVEGVGRRIEALRAGVRDLRPRAISGVDV